MKNRPSQKDIRRSQLGLANPKHDFWAKRKFKQQFRKQIFEMSKKGRLYTLSLRIKLFFRSLRFKIKIFLMRLVSWRRIRRAKGYEGNQNQNQNNLEWTGRN